ncbi:helix-turn-helix transcriptional regulator [Rossellomorea vietnamensis]|uniref:Helix-turn-helix transcriptional regulator n=1 Tax=Rossellomorea vietnamensis TaxID=218284 RepID=A0A5D4KD17_9BACI|nr:helix-turn-helix domain-containing protein [Rossellomorea vietnamensis]TYR75224.1 helix-turn-helix transcriptional regulator [Rossellomorea vietnamensis]
MDFGIVGQKIRELRKNIGLSQEELSEGICTQAQISKIEKGDVYPYASTLYLISRKLGVDVNYFFDIGMTPRLDYVLEVGRQLKMARRNLDYKEMKSIVTTEEENPLFFNNKRNQQILLWHKGIYQYELDKDLEKAEQTLREAIKLTHTTNKIWTEREIEILLNIGVMYFESGFLEHALANYKEVKTHIEALPHLNDYTIKTRLFYNIARVLTRLLEYQESNEYCKEAIHWCIDKDNMYLLGELHYHIGYNCELQEDRESARKYMQKALTVFELQEDDKYINFINKKIKDFPI